MMLSMSKKIAYGMGRFGSSFLLSLTALTTFYIYGEYFTLNWLLAGIALATSYVVIGLTSWLIGYLSDGAETRWGRRKPFVIIGAPGLAVTGFLLFVPNWFFLTTGPSQQATLFFYYLIVLCSFKFFYAFLTTPFQSWLPEITDEDERPLVSSMQNTSNWVANGLGVVLGFITPQLFITSPAPAVSQLGLLIVVIFAIITILFYLPSIIWVREKPNIVVPKRSLVQETAIVLRNRTYVGWMIAVGFLSFSLAAVNAQVVGFAQKVLLLNTLPLLLPPAISLLVATIIFLFVWIKLIRRVGKGRSTTIAMAFLALLLATTPFLNLLSPTIPAMFVAIIFFIPVAACIAVYYLMSYVVPADIAQVDEIETGQSRSGMYTGFIGVPLNFFQAASALLLGWLMDYSVVSYGSNAWGLMWWGPLFAPFLIVAAIILHYVNIDPDFKALWAKKTGA